MGKNSWLVLAVMLVMPATALNAAVKVGNGDDGSDLEGATPITSGKILESRAHAVELLNKLNTAGVPGLGSLLPELANSNLYLAKKDVAALPGDQSSFHTNMKGQVYARTFATPYAPTRYFPAAEGLDGDQLVSLHIHEALHRSLPAKVREDESVVSRITLAITSPEASNDRIRETAANLLPGESVVVAQPNVLIANQAVRDVVPERFEQPSSVGYLYRQFKDSSNASAETVSKMHVIHSDLYAFGSSRTPLGLGLEASVLKLGDNTMMGPFSISPRMRIWSKRGFDIGIFSTLSLNTLSAQELKNSPFGRDVGTVGISMRKESRLVYVENFLSWTTPGSSKQTLGKIDYNYQYGSVVQASVHAGVNVWRLRAGAYGELYLADYFKVEGGAFSLDTGRYRILGAGPEVKFVARDFEVGLNGRFLLDATKGTNFDYLGNLMGPGVSQGSVTASLSVFL